MLARARERERKRERVEKVKGVARKERSVESGWRGVEGEGCGGKMEGGKEEAVAVGIS